MAKFRVGVSADFKTRAANLLEPVLAEKFDPIPEIEYEFMPELKPTVTPDQIAGYDAILSLSVRMPPESFAGVERLAVIARWGVGYDMIDVPACTAHNVALCITPDGIRRPVAEGIIALLLAVTKRITIKDRMVRENRWLDVPKYMGVGLQGRTLGSIGIGNIGGDMFRLLRPFDLGRMLAYDPYTTPERAAALGVELVDLDTLLAESDFVCVNCPLTAETRHLMNAERFRRMKPTAFFVNTARGPIVDEDALVTALREGWIAGAALDVFEQEPLPLPSALTEFENVILAPHAVAWTDQSARGNGGQACDNILSVFRGEIPHYTVNADVGAKPEMQAKLAALRSRWG